MSYATDFYTRNTNMAVILRGVAVGDGGGSKLNVIMMLISLGNLV